MLLTAWPQRLTTKKVHIGLLSISPQHGSSDVTGDT